MGLPTLGPADPPTELLTPGDTIDTPVVACEDCGTLVLARLTTTHDRVCPARIVRALAGA